MFIRKVKIHNFKCYRDFEITLEEGLNIVVGDNEAGKSTILDIVVQLSRQKSKLFIMN